MTNEKNCVLRSLCALAGSAACTQTCTDFIAMHGFSGKGGRVGDTIPKEYQKYTIADNPVRDSQPDAFKKFDILAKTFGRQFIEDASDPKDLIKNVYLWSAAPGTGKTATACAIANDFQAVHYVGSLAKGIRPDDRPAFFLDMAEFQTLYNEFNRSNVPRQIAEPAALKYYRMMDAAKNARLLIMDDIGARSATEGFGTDVHAIVNHRYKRKLPFIATSNKPLAALSDMFDQKFMDRLRDLTIVEEFAGTSKRGKR